MSVKCDRFACHDFTSAAHGAFCVRGHYFEQHAPLDYKLYWHGEPEFAGKEPEVTWTFRLIVASLWDILRQALTWR